MSGLRLVADDLTGALDAAAAFARNGRPVAVLRDADMARGCPGAWALDAATRETAAADARASAERIGPMLRGASPAFRKVDSMLRGHVAEEIAATARAGGFASVVIAPAFPAQGRIMREGRQLARRGDGSWDAIGVDLRGSLRALGLATVPVPPGGAAAGRGGFLCDARTDEDLHAIAACGRRVDAPVLWCGSAGLARALAGSPERRAVPTGPTLGVVGTRHPAARDEVARLRRRQPQAVLTIAAEDAIAEAADRAGHLLRDGRSVVLVLRLPELPPASAAAALRRLAHACTALHPATVYASGGDTLAALFEASGSERLDCAGEIAPGVPLSRFAGGAWNGTAVVSKSGGFVAGDVLATLFECDEEKQRVQA